MGNLETTPDQLHTSLLTEQVIQNSLDNPENITDLFAEFEAQLEERLPNNAGQDTDKQISAAYAKARRMRQASFTVGYFAMAPTAMERMLGQLETANSLVDIPTEPPFAHKLVDANSSESYDRILRGGSYWLVDTARTAWHEMSDASHPFNAIIPQMETGIASYYNAIQPWMEGPGKNRWPAALSTFDGARERFSEPLLLNVQESLDLVAGKTINELLRDPDVSPEEIMAKTRQAIPAITRRASVDRHLYWRPDWRDIDPALSDTSATNGAKTLIAYLEDGDYEKLETYADNRDYLRDENICPHNSIADKPWERAGACFGNPRAQYSDPEKQLVVDRFFAAMGIERAEDTSFNLAEMALSMSVKLQEDLFESITPMPELAGV